MAKDNICVIYDDDESYAKRLMGIINDSKDIPYRAKVFTKEEEFNRYILANKTDVLMVNEEQYTYGINHEDIKTDDNSVIVLCEDEKEAGIINDKKEKGLIGVCKYQPAYQLLGSITRQRPDRTQRVEDITRYIGVYGFNSTLRVTLAMVIAAAYSKKGRTLFINLDEFSGIEHIMMSDGCSNLSDVFYMFKQAGEHFTQQIRECIKANELFDYIPAVVCADDISYVNDRLISGLLDELAHNLKYDYIVVNISEGIDVCIYEISQHRAISVHNRELLRQQLYNSIKRLDILQELLEDDDITEIMINGYKDIFIEKKGRITKWNKQFESREKLEDIAQRIAAMSNKTINEAIPIVDTRLADGSRVNMVLSPIAIDGPVITIRKFYDTPIDIDRLIELGSITKEAADFLELLVKCRYNIFVSGGTGSGG